MYHDLSVATLRAGLAHPEAHVVPSEGSAIAFMLPVDVHVDIGAVSLIHPIGSWLHILWHGVHSYPPSHNH
jgi:hypothetical protein